VNVVDVIVIVAVVVYAFSGYRNGAVAGALSVGGFLIGAVVGGRVAGPISSRLAHGTAQIPVAVLIVVACALLVQALGVAVAYRLRRRITWRPARALDQTLGAVLSAVGVLIVVWMLALPLASSPSVRVSRAIRESSVVHAIDGSMPGPVRSAYSSLRDLADREGFPQVFGELQASHIRDVAPPNPAVAGSAATTRARASIVKVLAGSGGCGHDSEGSGFVYAPGRVLTNAHVVAGMKKITVQDDGNRTASVVLFDPDVDVAVLRVNGLTGAPLTFAAATPPARSGTSAVAAGYPEDGPFDPEPARIRDVERAYGKNIYGDDEGGHRVGRDIYSIRALVRPGNSGGPLLTTDGRVLGVVFATAVDAADTGYALTAGEVSADAGAGRRATSRVSTQSCISE
jgi:S1-C subfamily serine protease